MAISRRLLNEGEHVVLSTRTHVKALIMPALALILISGLAGYLSSLPDGERASTWQIVIWSVAGLLIAAFVVLPFLRWLTTTYTFTSRRLITRTGIVTRKGHDVQLTRISDVSYEKGLVDRMLGCGTLVISDAGDLRIELHDIPRVEQTQLILNDQLHHGPRETDDGS